MTFFRRLLGLVFPAEPSPRPSDASPYRQWARDRGLRLREEDGLRVIGCLHGRDVIIDPGIDGPSPGFVQVRIAVALPGARPLLMTRATKPTTFAMSRLRALFSDPILASELRAISVNVHHLRLRFAPCTSPLVVDHAVEAVRETLRIIHAAPESVPRHSCTTRRASTPSTNTTVPYPT